MRKAVRAPSITKKGIRPARVSTPMPVMPRKQPMPMPPAPEGMPAAMKKGGAAKKMKKGGKAC